MLDMCCGPRMFYFDSSNTICGDIRSETHVVADKSSKGGFRKIEVSPDVIFDFTNLPFANNTFDLVIFDPPHLKNNGGSGWLAKKYGKLKNGWEIDISLGFFEAFRVLRRNGTLIFKWNENDIPLKNIMALCPYKPILGHKSGKNAKTHWLVFHAS